MKRVIKHLPHYLSLIGILVFGLLAFTIFSYDRSFQIAVAAALSLAYISWGVVHHYIHKDLYLSVVLEYIVVSLLGFVIITSLLLRV